jgi:AraC-like DNA-binding protein
MKVEIIDIQHKLLSQYIQSFLFISASGAMPYAYTTFPNTNLCLAIYRSNSIDYIREDGQNLCQIYQGTELFKSRLYGFHDQPFNARIQSSLDQICILFYPGALRAFTNVPFDELLACERVFDMIFSFGATSILEQVFTETSNELRAQILESFLLKRCSPLNASPIVLNAMTEMTDKIADQKKIDAISHSCGVHPSTLYRLFLSGIGQSPKAFLNTLRFRKALRHVLTDEKNSFTNITYQNSFYDQPHFIKEIRRFSGYSPAQLRKIASIEQQQLAWIVR